MIVSPASGAQLANQLVQVSGWAWSDGGIRAVQVSVNNNQIWVDADVERRHDFSWQKFSTFVTLPPGAYQLTARATSSSGLKQPISRRRNHVHNVRFEVLG